MCPVELSEKIYGCLVGPQIFEWPLGYVAAVGLSFRWTAEIGVWNYGHLRANFGGRR